MKPLDSTLGHYDPSNSALNVHLVIEADTLEEADAQATNTIKKFLGLSEDDELEVFLKRNAAKKNLPYGIDDPHEIWDDPYEYKEWTVRYEVIL